LCRRLRFRAELASYITGALETLTMPYVWEAFGDLTPEQVSEMATEALNSYLEGGDMCRIGTICEYITTDPPEGVLPLDGTTYNGADYPDLYSVLDDAFLNGDGTFTLHDASGRVAVFAGTGSGLSVRSVGDTFGVEAHTLIGAEIPAHTHSYLAPQSDLLVVAPGEVPGSTGIGAPSVTGGTGGGGAHENMQPSIVWKVGVWYK